MHENNKVYILYGIKDNYTYYISNVEPIIWTTEVEKSKIFNTSKSAQNCIFDNYNAMRNLVSLLNTDALESFYISSRDNNNIQIEMDRRKILK